MAVTKYITYEEYQNLGGSVSEDAFDILERKAQRYLDYFTFNRIKYLTTIPDEVKEVLVDFISKLNEYAQQSVEGDTIESYSNGTESITYKRLTESEVSSALAQIALKWLPDYLVNRSVHFDVEKYLQSANNNS